MLHCFWSRRILSITSSTRLPCSHLSSWWEYFAASALLVTSHERWKSSCLTLSLFFAPRHAMSRYRGVKVSQKESHKPYTILYIFLLDSFCFLGFLSNANFLRAEWPLGIANGYSRWTKFHWIAFAAGPFHCFPRSFEMRGNVWHDTESTRIFRSTVHASNKSYTRVIGLSRWDADAKRKSREDKMAQSGGAINWFAW